FRQLYIGWPRTPPRDGGGGRVRLDAALLDEGLNEGETLAQGRYRDVPAVFAAVLGQGGDQVVGDEFQLRSRVVSRKPCQFLEPGVAQTSRISQECHAGWDR